MGTSGLQREQQIPLTMVDCPALKYFLLEPRYDNDGLCESLRSNRRSALSTLEVVLAFRRTGRWRYQPIAEWTLS